MVEKFKRFFSMGQEGMHDAALVLGLSALASQALALVRDRIFAHMFGAGEVLDVYYAAFKIPDLIFVSVASLVSVTVLIPYFTHALEKGNDEARRIVKVQP